MNSRLVLALSLAGAKRRVWTELVQHLQLPPNARRAVGSAVRSPCAMVASARLCLGRRAFVGLRQWTGSDHAVRAIRPFAAFVPDAVRVVVARATSRLAEAMRENVRPALPPRTDAPSRRGDGDHLRGAGASTKRRPTSSPTLPPAGTTSACPTRRRRPCSAKGAAWSTLGRAPEAAAPLAAAREIFARLGAMPALAETDEWLASGESDMSDALACPSCGAENPAGAKFCDGVRSAAGSAPSPSPEERKVVTTLFCDLVAFTAMSEAADPEDVDALLGDYFARAHAR